MNALAPIGYLDTLNPAQRRAVVHGVGAVAASSLLVIAGAGSGKTKTLAHRVAHLLVNGVDPRRILLMTFSRRAASEISKRVERITRKDLGDGAGVLSDALTWAGTFHGIGARLLRDCADQLGLERHVAMTAQGGCGERLVEIRVDAASASERVRRMKSWCADCRIAFRFLEAEDVGTIRIVFTDAASAQAFQAHFGGVTTSAREADAI